MATASPANDHGTEEADENDPGARLAYPRRMTDTPRQAAEQTAEAVGRPILEYGRAWMSDPATGARAVELGFEPPFGLWVNGRAGVLGDVDADVAAAAIGFMAPDRVRQYWESRPAEISPARSAELYAEAAATWGRQALASVPSSELERLDELADRVSAAADPSIGTLFAGWRALPRPDDLAGRVTIVLNVLRELRGAAHLAASHAVGLGPHGAIASAEDQVRGGVAGAERFGWTEPHPSPEPERRAEAERLTTSIVAPAFATLDAAEQQELISLVATARAVLDS